MHECCSIQCGYNRCVTHASVVLTIQCGYNRCVTHASVVVTIQCGYNRCVTHASVVLTIQCGYNRCATHARVLSYLFSVAIIECVQLMQEYVLSSVLKERRGDMITFIIIIIIIYIC